MTQHFHAWRGPGGRFQFVRNCGGFTAAASEGNRGGRGKPSRRLLVVAFASLGSGVVRREWLGCLQRASEAHLWPQPFDALFVADPASSW